jgi:hypothetical protein
MKSIYTEKTSDGTDYIERIDPDGSIWSIPCDPTNSDYQAYLNKDKPVEQSTPMIPGDE